MLVANLCFLPHIDFLHGLFPVSGLYSYEVNVFFPSIGGDLGLFLGAFIESAGLKRFEVSNILYPLR